MNTAVAACPYCGVVLEPVPSRTKKCQECGEKVIRRRDRFTDEISYLTVDDNYRADCYLRLDNMGLSNVEDRFAATEAQLERDRGMKPTPQDAYWRVLNEVASEGIEQGTVESLGVAHFAYTFMELELKAQGRDPSAVIKSREQVSRLQDEAMTDPKYLRERMEAAIDEVEGEAPPPPPKERSNLLGRIFGRK